MAIEVNYTEAGAFHFCAGGEILFTVRYDGTIERGAGFTTIDEMSLKFWKELEKLIKKEV